MSTENSQKNLLKYYCSFCDFLTYNKNDYNRHIKTNKHLINTDSIIKPEKKFLCETCLKVYKERTGLWRHKKKCMTINICNENEFENDFDNYNKQKELQDNIEDDNINQETDSKKYNNADKSENKELIKILIQENSELKGMMMEVLKNGSHNVTNNNTINNNLINKAFNINFYLNETCKNAMNITEFIDSIQTDLDDLEYTGKYGYVEGVSNIIKKNLSKLKKSDRPIHCSDVKRETIFIKDNNEWIKETVEKPLLTKAIKHIAMENIKQINKWKDVNPEYILSTSRKNDKYLQIVGNSMSGTTKEESDTNLEKIITNVAKQTVIQKDM